MMERKLDAMRVNTIDVNVRQWRDKVNGNNYQAGHIVIDYGMKNERTIYIPFQYGDLIDCGVVKQALYDAGIFGNGNEYHASVSYICRELDITYRYNIVKDCLKKDVISYGKE